MGCSSVKERSEGASRCERLLAWAWMGLDALVSEGPCEALGQRHGVLIGGKDRATGDLIDVAAIGNDRLDAIRSEANRRGKDGGGVELEE